MPLVSKWPATFELNGFLFNLPERVFSCNMFPSLARLAQESLKRDPHAGDLYVFRGRRGGLIKIIWHDGHGACLLRT
jgi:transposase